MNSSDLSANEKSAVQTFNGSWIPVAGRTLIAAIFLLSGVSKLTDPASALGYIASSGFPLTELAYGTAVLVEILGGVALIAGYRVKLVAGILAAFSLTTALMFHANLADQNQFIHFFKNIAMTGGLLQIVTFGTGRLTSNN